MCHLGAVQVHVNATPTGRGDCCVEQPGVTARTMGDGCMRVCVARERMVVNVHAVHICCLRVRVLWYVD